MYLVISNLVHPAQKYYDEAIRRGEEFLKGREQDTSPATLDVRWILAKALLAKSKLAADQADREQFTASAQAHAEVVARHDGRYNTEARFLMQAMTGNPYPRPEKDANN